MKTALLQLTSSDDPSENLRTIQDMVSTAAEGGARFILTPEVSNCVSTSQSRQKEVLRVEDEDQTLLALRAQARTLGIWLLIGSLGLKTNDPDGRFANRSFLIEANGSVVATYDKIHMFDVDVTPEETYRESDGYRPGEHAVTAEMPFGKLGMAICYDLRFPLLFNALAKSGACVLTVPAAFSPVTGVAHWEPLLRARAIESGCWVIAPAQCGQHSAVRGKSRRTHGHSLVVSPWGEVVLDAGTEPGIHFFDLDVTQVDAARRRVPSLANARSFTGP